VPWGSAYNSGAAPESGSTPTGGGWGSAYHGAADPVAAAKSKGGGFFHDLLHNPVTHVAGQTVTDLKNAAVNAPAGVYNVAKTGGNDVLAIAEGAPASDPRRVAANNLGNAILHQTVATFKHPLRHPGDTLLLALPAVGAVGKASEVGALAKAGKFAEAGQALTSKRVPPPRVIEAGGVQARLGNYSQAPAARFAQQAIDRLRAQFPERAVPGMQTQYERVGKALAKNRAVETKIVSAPFTQLRAAGKGIKWDSPEGVAMRAVAEGTSLDARIAAHAKDLATATTTTAQKAIQKQIRIAMKARTFVKDTPEGLTITDPKLAALYEKTKAAALLEDKRLTDAGLMTHDAAQAAIQKPGRLVTGAIYETPTPGKLGRSPALNAAVAQRDQLAALHEQALNQQEKWHAAQQTRDLGPLSEADAKARLAQLDAEYAGRVKQLIPETSPYGGTASKQEQLRRNFENSRAGKGKRVGVKRQQTVSAEEFKRAEETLLAVVEKHRGTPYIDRLANLIQERDRLRSALNARTEAAFGGEAGPALPRAPWPAHVSVPRGSDPVRNRIVQIGHRLEAAEAKVARLENAAASRVKPTGVVGNEGFSAGQFHVGYERRNKPFSIRKEPGLGKTDTLGIATRPGRLRNELTGANFHQGAFRNDVPSIVADNALESERYLATERARQFFLDVAKDTPEGIRPGKAVAIRTDLLGSNPMAAEVKDFLDAQRSVRQADEHTFNPLGLLYDDYRQQVFPNIDASDFERYAGHVKWIDKDLLGGLNKPGPLATLMQHESAARVLKWTDAINNAQKFAILYLKPAYAVPNMVGNAFLNTVQQGWAAPANLTRAARLARHIGPEDAAVIRDLMGEGIGGSLESRTGITAGLNNFAARHVFEPLVDTPFRLASFLYEARRELGLHGTMNAADWQKVRSLLHDETLRPNLMDATSRANKAIIDYGDLTPVEQSIIRRIVFFYPWLKGSTKYAGHFLAEHPFQAGAIGALGQNGQQFSQQGLGNVPSWAEGYFKVGGSDRFPLIVNPTAAGVLNQPGQIAETLNQFVSSGNPNSAYTLANNLTPALAAALATLSGKDAFTNKNVPRNASTFVKQFESGVPLQTLIQRLTQDQTGRTFPVSHSQAWLQYLLGGLAPKTADRVRLNSSYAAEQKPLRP
jgi:hypothetical protein